MTRTNPSSSDHESMRIQKYLSQSGVCSRRKAEEYIRSGLVTVNGVPAQLGQKVRPDIDDIQCDARSISNLEKFEYYVFHKPRGVVSSCADEHETDISDIVDVGIRVYPVGRLDKNTTGLILLTNDGRITHRLLHPSFQHEKEYVVHVYGRILDQQLETMSRGVLIQGVRTRPCRIRRIASGSFSIVLTEGRNRQIRRMVESLGHQVKKLKRVRIENVQLGDLPVGEYRPLRTHERAELFRRIGLQESISDMYAPSAPRISGEVIHGDGRGRALGFPTANIHCDRNDLLDATYVTHVFVEGQMYLGAGVHLPSKKTFEVHILDFDADIYGAYIAVDIIDKIRDNVQFSSTEALQRQITHDIAHIRELANTYE